jgi:hypothetical protein
MKGYSFRLGTVLRVRRVEALQARQRVGVAARSLAVAVGLEREATQSYESSLDCYGELDGPDFLAAQQSGERLAAMMASSSVVRITQERRLGAQRLAALHSERRVAVLERLDERRRREWLVAVQHEDVAVLDDFATVRAATGAIGAAKRTDPGGARETSGAD